MSCNAAGGNYSACRHREPPRGSRSPAFIAWANERPARLEMPAIDGMFIYLAGKYPCPAMPVGKPEVVMKRLVLGSRNGIAAIGCLFRHDHGPAAGALGHGNRRRRWCHHWCNSRKCRSWRWHWSRSGSRWRLDLQSGQGRKLTAQTARRQGCCPAVSRLSDADIAGLRNTSRCIETYTVSRRIMWVWPPLPVQGEAEQFPEGRAADPGIDDD